jgi:hypothetical protein
MVELKKQKTAGRDLAMADVNVGHKLNIHHKCGVAAKK